MSQQTVSMKISATAGSSLKQQLAACDFSFASAAYAHWQARGDAIVTYYQSGKLVLQGKHVEPWVLAVEELGGTVSKWAGQPRDGASAPTADATSKGAAGSKKPVAGDGPNTGTRFDAAIAKLPKPYPTAWIGIDETGKGDYFGPLVVVAARVELEQLPLLAELGVGDSKRIPDSKILKLAAQLKAIVPFEKVVLMPPAYNALYGKIGNLNKLLAWAHATAAEGLLENGTTAELILSDQFSKADIISSRLKERGKQLRFTQRTRAEEDPAVGCASIFARAEFLYRMKQLSEETGVEIPKGAGSPVLSVGRSLVASRGGQVLDSIAKLHFKTTGQLR